MSAIDIFFILAFVVAVVYGYRRGAIMQMGSVAGVLVGILACRLFGDMLTSALAGSDADANDVYVSGVFACVILFVAGYIVARVVARVVHTVAKTLKLNLIDRLCGSVFCLFEWLLAISLALNVWQALKPDAPITDKSSLAGGRCAEAVLDFAPKVLGSETAQSIFNIVGTDL